VIAVTICCAVQFLRPVTLSGVRFGGTNVPRFGMPKPTSGRRDIASGRDDREVARRMAVGAATELDEAASALQLRIDSEHRCERHGSDAIAATASRIPAYSLKFASVTDLSHRLRSERVRRPAAPCISRVEY
jgi:hypothetical protein